MAPPAAGKGVQSNLVSRNYGLPHISTGDLLRNVDDPDIQKQLSLGKFVDNDLVAKLLKDRIMKDDCKNGYVLDGFPRNMTQVAIYENLCKLNNGKHIIIVLDISKEIGEKRIVGRLTCPSCGAVFNELLADPMPKVQGICDFCGSELFKRADDTASTYENRYNLYLEATEPLIDYYEKKGIVYHVSASSSEEETYKQIEKIIGGFYDKH